MKLFWNSKFLLRLPTLDAWLDQIAEFGNTRLAGKWDANIE